MASKQLGQFVSSTATIFLTFDVFAEGRNPKKADKAAHKAVEPAVRQFTTALMDLGFGCVRTNVDANVREDGDY